MRDGPHICTRYAFWRLELFYLVKANYWLAPKVDLLYCNRMYRTLT